MIRSIAGRFAHSRALARGRTTFEQNTRDWDMQLSKSEKLLAGVYLILSDYARGVFPPKFEDMGTAHAAEVNFRAALPGVDAAAVRDVEMRKPFWFGRTAEQYLCDFLRLMKTLESEGVHPPAALLELGCGTGWMAEFLALAGFHVTGLSIAPADIEDARTRTDSLRAKGLDTPLEFHVGAMEDLASPLAGRSYDCIFVFEALHHAFDWRAALRSAHAHLNPGGRLLICNEPNLLHTFVAYRVARLSNTHEIGFSRSELVQELGTAGFDRIRVLSSRLHYWHRPHWIVARRG